MCLYDSGKVYRIFYPSSENILPSKVGGLIDHIVLQGTAITGTMIQIDNVVKIIICRL